MPRKYCASDFAPGKKPRITYGVWRFGDRVYTYRCVGPANSAGHGTTPKDAYNAWERNFRRRVTFYTEREEASARGLEAMRRRQIREEQWKAHCRLVHSGARPNPDDFSVVEEKTGA